MHIWVCIQCGEHPTFWASALCNSVFLGVMNSPWHIVVQVHWQHVCKTWVFKVTNIMLNCWFNFHCKGGYFFENAWLAILFGAWLVLRLVRLPDLCSALPCVASILWLALDQSWWKAPCATTMSKLWVLIAVRIAIPLVLSFAQLVPLRLLVRVQEGCMEAWRTRVFP